MCHVLSTGILIVQCVVYTSTVIINYINNVIHGSVAVYAEYGFVSTGQGLFLRESVAGHWFPLPSHSHLGSIIILDNLGPWLDLGTFSFPGFDEKSLGGFGRRARSSEPRL